MSGERDNAVFHGNTDAGCIDLRLEFKLFHDGFAQTQVAHVGVLSRMRGLGRALHGRSLVSTPEPRKIIELYQQGLSDSLIE
jgi:hypothetical protein